MLRMGRSTRVEPGENERTQNSQPAPQVNTPQPQSVQPDARERVGQPAPQAAPAAHTASTTRASSESETLARELREGVMSGFLGGNSVVKGDAEFKGMLRIDGRFTGHIRSEKGTLIVSAGGKVDADVVVAAAKVNGVVNGDITASERVELGRTAVVHGNISAPTLVVEQGAIFEGNCRMARPAVAADGAQRPAVKSPTVRPTAAATQLPQPAVPKMSPHLAETAAASKAETSNAAG